MMILSVTSKISEMATTSKRKAHGSWIVRQLQLKREIMIFTEMQPQDLVRFCFFSLITKFNFPK